ncbi:MAG: hypothetical protein JRH15_22855 [Deltaproteobacteria bacterium]|nr:hypothetical protein [Deltaproteobacteria bacterium]
MGPDFSQFDKYSQVNDFDDEPSRQKLTKMVMRLFGLWALSTADQLEVLGLSRNSRRMLTQYRRGKALPNNRDMLDRLGWLLVIHQNLRTLYPKNPELCYSWVKRKNRYLGNWAPLEVMKEQGFIGIFRVAQLIEHLVEL